MPVYEGSAAIDPVSHRLSARWSIRFVADSSTTDSVDFLLNAGLMVSRISGHNVVSYVAQPRDDRQVVTVRLMPHLASGSAGRIDLEYAGVPVFGSDSINGIAPGWIELGLDSHWFPVFADYSKQIAAHIRIELPRGWEAVASGNITRDGNFLVLETGIPQTDIAFAASPVFRHADAPNSSVYWVRADSSTVTRVLEVAESCRRYLNERYGSSDSLPAVRLVLAPRTGPAYARRNYVVLTDAASAPAPALSGYICHEFAHFWSIAANSSGPENWLNEGMAEYVSSRYVRATFGQTAYDSTVARWRRMSTGQPPIWTPQSTRRPSAMVAYRKAPFLLTRLEERIGTDTMDRFLRRYMVERIRTTPQLLAVLQDVAGADAASWFREELAR
ncbi:MAG TPA: M1 family aminopeptidase [Gemmatimonadaceae bacterium]|nr:M1 family aminopeptidase [Gemmatimonadaceae bacterium]